MADRPGRQLAAWGLTAVAAVALLLGVLRWEHRHAGARWSPLLVGSAHAGAETFRSKGCVACHASGPGARVRTGSAAVSGPGELVSAMWNHAPQMWLRMKEQQVAPASLSQRDMANVFAYLYTARTVDAPGDVAKGRDLFTGRCASCHSHEEAAGARAPALSALSKTDSPVAWAAAMWGHPVHTAAPFGGTEMSDLLAFIRGGREVVIEPELLASDPDRGARLFRERSCAVCHAPRAGSGGKGAEFRHELPPNVVEFAGVMWNHASAEAGARAPMTRQQMADVVAFVYALRYREPGGAPRAGELLYAARGCGRCHGEGGEGTSAGPALRGRGRHYSAIALAATIWRHGPGMYRQTREMGIAWPTLTEANVGDLIAFLNTPPGAAR